MYIFDLHQDISSAITETTHSDFWCENEINQGWNNLGLPVNNQTDFIRLKKGNIKAVFGSSGAFSVNERGEITPSENHFKDALRQIEIYIGIQNQKPTAIQIIKSKNDLKGISEKTLSFLLALEGADSIGEDFQNLHTFYEKGIRSIGLTWNFTNRLAGGCSGNGGLTLSGEKTIKEMNDLGILLDLSHINKKSFFQALEVNKKPVIVSHTACQKIWQHERNITDEQMQAIAKTGGVVGICGVPRFVGVLNIKKVTEHIVYAVKNIGIDHVAIGTDFGTMTEKNLIPQFKQSSDLPFLIKELKNICFSNSDIEKITYKNVIRILEDVLPVEK